jgi:polyferredoxin
LARKIVQYLALLLFLVLFIGLPQRGRPDSLVNSPMRLDPLLVLAHLLASRVLLASSLLALVTITLTLVFGRAWCGWLCPLGTVLDIAPLDRWRNKINISRTPTDSWRSIKYALLLAVLFAALFGNLTLLIFDPLAILFRTLTISGWPALDQLVTASEAALYRLPFLSRPISWLDAWLRPDILPTEPLYYRETLIFAGLFLGIIMLNLVAPRFWCRYLCPLGGLLGLFSKIALFRRQVGDKCKGCQLCTQSCPTGTINPEKNYASDTAECTMCLECMEACPRSSIAFTPRLQLTEPQLYDPGRRQLLTTMGLTAAGIALLRSDALTWREHPHQLRPPGAREGDFLSKCIRCAECMRACPTSALQPAITESGLEGLWTPIVTPRLGYCDYSCNACGQICPVQAIPSLKLETKRTKVIGHAYIDRDRCIAWADHRDCIVCEEMCPIPDKAIYLEPTQVTEQGGNVITVHLPYVDRDACIGCGICEYKCPVNGEAAIRVYVPSSDAPLS